MSDMTSGTPSGTPDAASSAPPTGDAPPSAGAAVVTGVVVTETVGTVEDVSPGESLSDFKQLYTLLFCSLGLFVASIAMPIEGRHIDLYAKDSISGAWLTVFAGYGVLAGWMNIHGRKMIIWPVFFAAADGLYVCAMRAMQLVKQNTETLDFRGWVQLFGSGFYVIALLSLLVLWTLMTAVMAGAKKDAARKAEAKASRGKK